jgi:hypothetical protein
MNLLRRIWLQKADERVALREAIQASDANEKRLRLPCVWVKLCGREIAPTLA